MIRMIVKPYRIALLFIFIMLISCRNDEAGKTAVRDGDETEKALVGANRILVKKDAEKIAGYIKRRGWDMQETGTGLWYMYTVRGRGDEVQKGDLVTINYTVSLLDGTLCYSSEDKGPRQFKVGRGGVESGLEEGILLLREGDKARFILPPHLAYGLVGDDDKIPARSIILYEVELIEVDK